MMKRFRNLTIALTVLAAGLVLLVGVHASIAYFTTYAESEGGKEIHFGHSEELQEVVTDLSKAITITNKENSQPVFVRARAFSGNAYTLTVSGAGWSAGNDGWYYYQDPLDAGESTSVLNAVLSGIPEEDLQEGTQVNVAVVYESTLAIYEYQEATDSYRVYADWANIQDSGTTNIERGGN